MNIKSKLFLTPLFIFSICTLSSCKGNVTDDSYIKSLDLFRNKNEVTVLQLTDMHWNYATDPVREKAYLQALVYNTHPDIIVSTGDNVCQANKLTWENLLDTLDSLNTPYCITYGNHDYQGYYRPTDPYSLMQKHKLCLNVHPNDDMDGETNFIVNLTDGFETKYQLYMIDSLNLSRGWSLVDPYDVISYGQLDWYAKQVRKANPESYTNAGVLKLDETGKIVKNPISSLAFFHIPLWQIEYAYKLHNGASDPTLGKLVAGSGVEHESVYSGAPSQLKGTRSYVGYKDTGFFELAENLRSTKGMFFGHDHLNDFAAQYYTKDDAVNGAHVITLGYGLKTGDGLSFENHLMGGNVIKIKSTGEMTTFRAFQDYSDNYAGGQGFKMEVMF